MTAHDALEAQVADYLTLSGWLVIRTHGPRNRPVEPGIPDLIVLRDDGGLRALYIEVKAGRDRMRREQAEWSDEARRRTRRETLEVRRLEDVVEAAR